MPTRVGSTMRNWSRWSDPDASKRRRCLSTLRSSRLPGPSVPSVIEGLSTVEVRWILPGQLDAAVAGWFGRFPAGLDSREDIYLIHPVLRGLSVKIRAIRASRSSQIHGRGHECRRSSAYTVCRPHFTPAG